MGEIAFDSDFGELAREHGSTHNISHHVIHDTREHASHLQLSLPPFSHSLIVLSSQFVVVVVFMRPYKTGKGRVKKEGTNEGNGGGNPPPIKPVYIEFLRRSSYPEREPTELGTFNFIGEDSAFLPPSLPPSLFPLLCFAHFISNF